MRISVNYDDTDVAKALSKIIKDLNGEEFIKLLTPMICSSQLATEYFFKLMLGNKLPTVIPDGTLCKLSVNSLSYGSHKEAIREKFADDDGKVVVTVKEFRGFHEYSQYHIEYTDVLENDTTRKDSTYVQHIDLEIVEEF